MAIVVRYFSTSAAGAGDGTTWADRAAFFSGGAYSTIMTSFDFGGSDTLHCYIGPGTYSLSATLDTNRFTSNKPTNYNPLLLHGCDSSGNLIEPDLSWNCTQGSLDVSSYPEFSLGSNLQIALNHLNLRCISIVGSNTGNLVDFLVGMCGDFLKVVNNANNVNQSCVAMRENFATSCLLTNSHLICNATTANGSAVISGAFQSGTGLSNVRMECTGTLGRGISGAGGNVQNYCRGPVCIFNCPSVAYSNISGGGGAGNTATCLTIHNCGTAISSATSTQGISSPGKLVVSKCFITACTNGIISPNAAAFTYNNRIRATTTYSTSANSFHNDDTAAGNDADEYVDAANGDFRIKKTSIYWGKGIGAGDEPASGGTSRPTSPFYQGVIG